MPHVSKYKLDKKFADDLFHEVASILERASERGELSKVLIQILTPTEKIMLAKRMAVISMLNKKIPIHEIAGILNMSSSTVDIMSLKYEIGSYNDLVEMGLKRKNIGDIIRILQTAGGIMPNISGKGRWKSLNSSSRKARIDSRFRKLGKKSKKK